MGEPFVHHAMFEWERREFGTQRGRMSEAHAEALHEAASAHRAHGSARSVSPSAASVRSDGERPGTETLRLERRSIRTLNHVGQVMTNVCSLEILPKIDRPDGRTPTAPQARARLVHMLGVACDIDLLVGSEASHAAQDRTLLDALIRVFADKLLDAVRGGLPRSYIRVEEDRTSLRGRLDAKRQFTTLLTTPQRLACRFDELSVDIALNRALAGTVAAMRPLAQTIDTQRRLAELAFLYGDVTVLPRTLLPWNQVRFDRTNERWRQLAALARLLVDRSWQSTVAGAVQGSTLLFDMNRLFESYVARKLTMALPANWSAIAQGGRAYCLTDTTDGARSFQTLPDIIVKRGGAHHLVIDTKWKRLKAPSADKRWGVAQADVYQMMAYASLYQADVILLYPFHGTLGEALPGLHTCHEIGGGNGRTLSMATVDVSRDDVTAQLRSVLRNVRLAPAKAA